MTKHCFQEKSRSRREFDRHLGDVDIRYECRRCGLSLTISTDSKRPRKIVRADWSPGGKPCDDELITGVLKS